jgi:hypothetical protein
MRRTTFYCLGAALLLLGSAAHADTFTFDTAPFVGIDVRNIPGRQIVGGEEFINFRPGTDVFSLDSAVFGVGDTVSFVNGAGLAIPSTGVNVAVLDTFDNDNNPATPFGAGNAADLIADRVTTSGPGFFVYFNQSLDLPRLVYSTDLSSHDADLQILARMLNLNGGEGRNAIGTFTSDNFVFTHSDTAVPEPSSVFLILPVLGACVYLIRRKRASLLLN